MPSQRRLDPRLRASVDRGVYLTERRCCLPSSFLSEDKALPTAFFLFPPRRRKGRRALTAARRRYRSVICRPRIRLSLLHVNVTHCYLLNKSK